MDVEKIIKSMMLHLPPVFSSDDGREWLSQHYKAPEKALRVFVSRGDLVRLKRGMYAFRAGFDPLFAAAILHPPSYVSFETALDYYRLIPERIETIISVVDGRAARFHTSLGHFVFHSQNRDLYRLGMTLVFSPQNQPIPIATREKAILDTLVRARLAAAALTPREIMEFLTEGLRIEQGDLRSLSLGKLRSMAKHYRNHAPRKLVEALTKDREDHRA